MKKIKLSTYAKMNDCCYRTAYNRFKKGTIYGEQLDSGTILIHIEDIKKENNKTAITYSRVSSNDKKNQLNEQSLRLRNYSINNGYIILQEIKEIASGMNDDRPKLNSILSSKVDVIIVENKDRLTRFGFNYIKTLLEKLNIELIVVNESNNDKEDLMKDFISLVTSFCGRIYGNRNSKIKEKKEKIIEIISE